MRFGGLRGGMTTAHPCDSGFQICQEILNIVLVQLSFQLKDKYKNAPFEGKLGTLFTMTKSGSNTTPREGRGYAEHACCVWSSKNVVVRRTGSRRLIFKSMLLKKPLRNLLQTPFYIQNILLPSNGPPQSPNVTKLRAVW